MSKPRLIDIVRRAYELWEHAGKPDGRDQEFYLEAENLLLQASASAQGDAARDDA